MGANLGYYSLVAALCVCSYALIAAVLGAKLRRASFVESAERAVIVFYFLVVLATGILVHALIVHDFSLEFVAHYSSSTLPLQYCITALWGGQAGSMLFWLFILGTYSVVALIQNQNKNRILMPYVVAVLMGISIFFLITLLKAANPFERIFPVPMEGQGLNPLLQNYWMQSHPPSLYTGYVGWAVPFAFAMAALITGRLDIAWIKTIRKWTLFAWLFLTLGILQGAYWAYIELGWGGYWAWDPVENASLMPWLASTAFLHSVMIQEKKGMLKMWNMVLVIISFTLSIFGTFLTRSGVVSSVHAFAQSPVGGYFVTFLVIQAIFSIFLLVMRRKELQPEQKLESFVSRESSFLFNNVFFLVITLAVLCGTTFPILSEWVTGSKVTVSAPFFNIVITPFAIGLILLTGICPLIAWRRASLNNLKRNFLWPLILGMISVVILIITGVRHAAALLFFGSCVFMVATMYFEFYRGTVARMSMIREAAPVAFYRLVERNRRRYGGFVIHAGMAVLIIGIAGSSYYGMNKEITVKPNESFTVRSYTLTYRELIFHKDPNKEVMTAKVDVTKNGKLETTLLPERHFYTNSDQPTTEVALRSYWNEDLYMILAGWDEQENATFKVYVNPLVSWIWLGGFIMGFGGIIVLLPDFRTQMVLSAAREDALGRESA